MALHLTQNGLLNQTTPEMGSSFKFQKIQQVSSLPEELILKILLSMTRSSSAPLATSTLACCSLVSQQWHRLANPILYTSPMINFESKHGAISFLKRIAEEVLDYELGGMSSIREEPKLNSLIHQIKRLLFFGEGRYRYGTSNDNKLAAEDRTTLNGILNKLWCTKIESLVFVELPFKAPFYQPIVNEYPTTLSNLILLTPLTQFDLLLLLRSLPTLAHLCIGSHDEPRSIPAEHPSLFNRNQLPSSNLQSFGIAARTLEHWLRTGMPWYENILNLIILPSISTITTLHIELADEDDERYILSLLGRPPSIQESEPFSSSVTQNSTRVEKLFKLENVFLRGFSSVLMAESLLKLEGIRKLCLSSIFATALRCPSLLTLGQTHSENVSMDSSNIEHNDSQPQTTNHHTGVSTRVGTSLRMLSANNLVWQSIPSSVIELSIEITRLPDHGPWNKKSSDHLTLTLTYLIQSGQCPHLKKLGTLLAETSFQFGIYGPHRNESPILEFVQAAATSGITLVPSFWNDSFVIGPLGTNWYH